MLLDNDIWQSVFRAHAEPSVMELSLGSMFTPEDLLREVARVLGRKFVAMDCADFTAAELCRAVRAAFRTKVLLFLVGFGELGAEVQSGVHAVFRDQARPFVETPDGVPDALYRPLVVVCATDAPRRAESLDVVEKICAPELMCLGLTKGADAAAQFLLAVMEFSHKTYADRPGVYRALGLPFVRGLCRLTAFLSQYPAVLGPCADIERLAFACYLTLLPRLSVPDRAPAKAFICDHFPQFRFQVHSMHARSVSAPGAHRARAGHLFGPVPPHP